mmetsp:Transcript_11209/g.45607  ORF Transcript_11209/g.45607 Transcript_11209/m.45607 type:complete len:228 (-) Transcript_11209:1180-1863(-)
MPERARPVNCAVGSRSQFGWSSLKSWYFVPWQGASAMWTMSLNLLAHESWLAAWNAPEMSSGMSPPPLAFCAAMTAWTVAHSRAGTKFCVTIAPSSPKSRYPTKAKRGVSSMPSSSSLSSLILFFASARTPLIDPVQSSMMQTSTVTLLTHFLSSSVSFRCSASFFLRAYSLFFLSCSRFFCFSATDSVPLRPPLRLLVIFSFGSFLAWRSTVSCLSYLRSRDTAGS